MEAATPLRRSHVTADERSLRVHDLVVEDETAARVVRERAEAGEDPARTVVDAVEIGARVLDRESAGAQADFVKAEFERASRQVEEQFTDRARKVADRLDEKVDEVFGEENGHLAKELEKLFSDGSSASVQNRVRELVAETLAKSREDLVRQFSSSDGTNPLADFKAGTVRELQKAHAVQQTMAERMGEMEKQLQALRMEREAGEELEAERERGTAKGRTFEEQVAEAVDAIAVAQGDCAEAVGDVRGPTGKTGDVVVDIAAAAGPGLGRIVLEAKDRKLSRPAAIQELDKALAERDADFAVLVVPGDDEVPARMETLREYNGDKLIVTLDPEDEARLALELGYRLARARVLMDRAGADGVDAGAVRGTVERARQAIEDVRKVKSQLTGATTNINNARELVEILADRVKAHLDEVEQLVSADAPPAEPKPRASADDPAVLGQQQLVVRVAAGLADVQLRGLDLLGHRPGGSRPHLVVARVDVGLDRRGVERVDRPDALAQALALERDRVRFLGLVGDRDQHRTGAEGVGRDRDLVLLDHARELERVGRPGPVLEVLAAAARRGRRRTASRRPSSQLVSRASS